MTKMERLRFKRGELLLEGVMSRPEGQGPYPAGVIAHPHPLFGGSMDNNVVYALFDALTAFGCFTLRFNFRGVGASQGQDGDAWAAADDIIAAAKFVKSAAGEGGLFVCGYSFGGLASLYAIARGLSPSALILISPMMPERGIDQDLSLKKILPLKIPALVLAGEQDQFFPPRIYKPFLVQGSELKLESVKGADHLWSGFEDEIRSRAEEFLGSLSGKP